MVKPIGNTTEGINNYYIKKDSSTGLTGGAIAAIVIIFTLIVIGIGVLVALIKNGVILSSKTNYDLKTLPQISTNSSDIII